MNIFLKFKLQEPYMSTNFILTSQVLYHIYMEVLW